MSKIDYWERKINSLDDQISDLLIQRWLLEQKMFESRRKAQKPLVDEARERRILDRVSQKSPQMLEQIFLLRVYRQILNITVDLFCRKLTEQSLESKSQDVSSQ